jgi:hypothetical protein
MAPTVDFTSTGDMQNEEFALYRTFFDEVPSARYDPKAKSWRIPTADMELLMESIENISLEAV